MNVSRTGVGVICALTLASAAASAGPAKGPCAQLKAACEEAGFTQGAAAEGSGLIIDCVLPLMRGQPQRPKAKKPLPQVSPDVVSGCRAKNPNFGQAGASDSPPAAAAAEIENPAIVKVPADASGIAQTLSQSAKDKVDKLVEDF